MVSETISLSDVIEKLNNMLAVDPDAISSIFKSRYFCNQELSSEMDLEEYTEFENTKYVIGILSLLDSFFGKKEDGSSCLTVNMGEGGRISGFSD